MFGILKTISRQEWLFVIIISLAVLTLTILPTLTALTVAASNNLYYTSGSLASPVDRTVYLSQIEEARQGHIFIHNLFTSEPQIGYLSPLWAALGLFSKISGLSPLFVFHLARLLLGFFLLVIIYLFISRIFSDIRWRKICFLVVVLNSGLGAFLTIPWRQINIDNVFGYFGIESWYCEGNAFLSLYHSPLYTISQIGIFLFFYWLVTRMSAARFKETLVIGFLIVLLGILHPYDLVILGFVSFTWLLTRSIQFKCYLWRDYLKFIMLGGFMAIPLIYFAVIKELSPGFLGWYQQNIVLTPAPLYIMRVFGIMSLFFVFGFYPAWKSSDRLLKFMVIWAVISCFLLYAPLPFQRRLGNGLYLPVEIIGLYGINYYFNKLRQCQYFGLILKQKLVRAVAAIMAIIAISLTTLYFLKVETDNFLLKQHFFISREEKKAMDWLKNNTNFGDIIASTEKTGNVIPAVAGRYVYLGHGHQTNNRLTKVLETEEVFFKTNINDNYKKKWLVENRIDYVYYGYNEAVLGDFSPETKPYLNKVFQNHQVKIFQVVRGE